MKKVPASEATRKRLEAVFNGEQIDPGRIVREGTRLLIEQALEAEVEQALGRRYYEHGKPGEVVGAMRNGVRRAHIDSAEGAIEFRRRNSRGSPAGRARCAARWPARARSSRAWRWRCMRGAVDARHRGGLHRYERALRAVALGRQRGVRAAVGGVPGFCAARSERALDIVYLFVDGVAERLHLGQPREAVLAAWGIDAKGGKALLALLPG
ncbi:MAG: hypothetical protein U1E90_11410 [Burkholderiaceae bacterium]